MHPWSSGQDAGFSLRNDGFDSRWVYHINTGETRNGYPHQTVNLALIEDCEFEPHLSHHFDNKKMGCKCCWGHTGFASLKDRFDPGTVHHFSGNSAAWLARLPWTQEVVSSNPTSQTISFGLLAQLVERGTLNPKVAGSSPAQPTISYGVSTH